MSKAEAINVTYIEDTANRYRVPKKQWVKWDKGQRLVFNHVHSAMIQNPQFFQHPQAEKVSRDHWKTTAWNAAWEAASAAL